MKYLTLFFLGFYAVHNFIFLNFILFLNFT